MMFLTVVSNSPNNEGVSKIDLPLIFSTDADGADATIANIHKTFW